MKRSAKIDRITCIGRERGEVSGEGVGPHWKQQPERGSGHWKQGWW